MILTILISKTFVYTSLNLDTLGTLGLPLKVEDVYGCQLSSFWGFAVSQKSQHRETIH